MICVSFLFQTQTKQLASIAWAEWGLHPTTLMEKAWIASKLMLSWRGLLLCLLAALAFSFWFLALTRLDLSVALPVASLALVINAVGSGLLLGETMGPLRLGGVLLVALGLVMVLKS
jgi:drug/metabolite transporter (DMT)-like permease